MEPLDFYADFSHLWKFAYGLEIMKCGIYSSVKRRVSVLNSHIVECNLRQEPSCSCNHRNSCQYTSHCIRVISRIYRYGSANDIGIEFLIINEQSRTTAGLN